MRADASRCGLTPVITLLITGHREKHVRREERRAREDYEARLVVVKIEAVPQGRRPDLTNTATIQSGSHLILIGLRRPRISTLSALQASPYPCVFVSHILRKPSARMVAAESSYSQMNL